MNPKFLETSSGQNLPIKKFEIFKVEDNLFIGGDKKLAQWSISEEKVTKDYAGEL